ncbi:MAG: leucine-rich repeat domain-containing protein [Mangrovibacterium sp.]
MKTIFLRKAHQIAVCLFFVCAGVITSCNKDDDAPGLELDKTILEIVVGDVASVNVTSGSGTYSVVSTMPSVATAVIDDNVVKITAIAEGDAELTVSDSETGKSKTIEVLVASNLTLNTPSYISAKEDEILNIEILSGSGDYSVLVADETVVMANISEGVLTINTLLEGTTTVTVTDNQTLKNAEITIVVEEYHATISFTASATWYYQITFSAAEEDQANVWIDLNNDGVKDDGEAVETFDEVVKYDRSDAMTIHGKVTGLTVAAIKMESIDLTKNKYLKKLTLTSQSTLTEIDLSQNTDLTDLDVRGSNLTELDLSKNTKLQYLSFNTMPSLVRLDLSNNKELETISGSSTGLTELILGDINKVKKLDVWLNSNLEPFSIANLKDLTFFRIYGNSKFTSFPDLSNNTKLEILSVGNIDFSGALIDFSKNTELKEVHVSKNKLGNADFLATIPNPEKIVFLSLNDNLLKTLDVSAFTSLVTLTCQSNQLGQDAMRAFVTSLPTCKLTEAVGSLTLIDNGRFITPAEQNYYDADIIAAIKAKNWQPYNQNSGASIIPLN